MMPRAVLRGAGVAGSAFSNTTLARSRQPHGPARLLVTTRPVSSSPTAASPSNRRTHYRLIQTIDGRCQ